MRTSNIAAAILALQLLVPTVADLANEAAEGNVLRARLQAATTGRDVPGLASPEVTRAEFAAQVAAPGPTAAGASVGTQVPVMQITSPPPPPPPPPPAEGRTQ